MKRERTVLPSLAMLFVLPQAELVNAPVTPDTIYVGRSSAISVIDLNGFGQGTGNPAFDVECPIQEGNSNFPNNPNALLQGTLLTPPLQPGRTTLDGGSEGPLTLTRSSELDDRLAKSPMLTSVADMMIGHSLDLAFNNGPPPFGCQAGGGNICAVTGLKALRLELGDDGTAQPGGASFQVGTANPVSWAPHPNPPPLVSPGLCENPSIAGQEPTSADTSLFNLLGPSANPLGNPDFCIPPAGLLSASQNAWFEGPSVPQANISACAQHAYRQQIGHFLYVVDRAADEVVVLNSNRFTVIDRINVVDPTDLAMSSNLDFLAVSSQANGEVAFLDIRPSSSTFHQVVKVTEVGEGPTEVAWDPGNEVIAVCNTGDDSVSLISAFSLEVQKTVRDRVVEPVSVVVSQRQSGFGYDRQVFFAWILNGNGTVAVYESGPDGPNGWGLDDVVAVPPFRFAAPKAMALDPLRLGGAVWIAHEDGQGRGTVSSLALVNAAPGQQLLIDNPLHDDLRFAVTARLGPEVLTGIPVDLAFDDLRNLGAFPNAANAFSAGSPLSVNGKSQVKFVEGDFHAANNPQFLFVCVPESSQGGSVIDVIERRTRARLDTNPFEAGTQSISVPGARMVVDYFRQ